MESWKGEKVIQWSIETGDSPEAQFQGGSDKITNPWVFMGVKSAVDFYAALNQLTWTHSEILPQTPVLFVPSGNQGISDKIEEFLQSSKARQILKHAQQWSWALRSLSWLTIWIAATKACSKKATLKKILIRGENWNSPAVQILIFLENLIELKF